MGTFLFKKEKEPKVTYDYQTTFEKLDIQYRDRLRELEKIIQKYNNAPPKVVREYITEKPTYIVNNYTDSIITVVDTIKGDTVIIDNHFLTLYPDSPKLIELELSKGLFSLTTLDNQASIKELEWPMDYDNYTYIYSEGKFNYRKINNNKNLKNQFNNLYMNFGYEIFNKRPYIGAEYNIPLGNRFRLDASINYIFTDDPVYTAPVGLGYRLLK